LYNPTNEFLSYDPDGNGAADPLRRFFATPITRIRL
jgi:hypothetical protein